jgi:hypothetical protein
MLSAEVEGGGPVVVGARLRQHRRHNSREFTLTFTVLAHEPPDPARHPGAGSRRRHDGFLRVLARA